MTMGTMMVVVACRAEGGLKSYMAAGMRCPWHVRWMDAESVNLCCLVVILRTDWIEAHSMLAIEFSLCGTASENMERAIC
jgi:hypothetical protein